MSRSGQLHLEAAGVLDAARIGSSPNLAWPLRQRAEFDHLGIWLTVRFVDHDERNPGFLLDYNAGDRTYDFDGYNHQGTDVLA